MKVSLKQVLGVLGLFAGLLGVGLAVHEERWAEALILGILVASTLMIYLAFWNRQITFMQSSLAKSPWVWSAVIAIVLGVMVGLVGGLFL